MSEAKKRVCVPQIGLEFPAPLIKFIFWPEANFLMWVGGGVGRPGLARAPNNTPGSLSNSLFPPLVPFLPPTPPGQSSTPPPRHIDGCMHAVCRPNACPVT